MEIATRTKDLLGKKYEIRRCTEEDIEPHFSLVKDFLEDHEVEQYKHHMRECIKANSAYSLVGYDCILYYKVHAKRCAYGHVLYGMGNPLQVNALFCGIFQNLDPTIISIAFKSHKKSDVSQFKSLVTKESLRRQGSPGFPLVVRIDKLKNRMIGIINKRGIAWAE